MKVSVKVNQELKPPISLDFGVCELSEEEKNRRRSTLAINFCIFFSVAAVTSALAYFLP